MAVSYNRLDNILAQQGITMADLRKAADIAPNTMTKIRKNEQVSMDVLSRICAVLNKDFGDIVEYIPEKS